MTSGAFASIVAALVGAYQTHLNHKEKEADNADEKKKRDTDDFFNRWMSAEDEVDRVRDENRKLKDKIAKLELKLKEKSKKNE
ncbi:hypothetical protein [Lactobacillus helveticus]|uniref:hypothetical protein n=1 Tax=Lactobacillus helveticus TaxID=1587 RepID=UPI001562B4A4|nr:hypothetical protein [Lactobacillus helveticus]NRO27688.1 hypothetical protein [Lactobacillus helveticus]